MHVRFDPQTGAASLCTGIGCQQCSPIKDTIDDDDRENSEIQKDEVHEDHSYSSKPEDHSHSAKSKDRVYSVKIEEHLDQAAVNGFIDVESVATPATSIRETTVSSDDIDFDPINVLNCAFDGPDMHIIDYEPLGSSITDKGKQGPHVSNMVTVNGCSRSERRRKTLERRITLSPHCFNRVASKQVHNANAENSGARLSLLKKPMNQEQPAVQHVEVQGPAIHLENIKLEPGEIDMTSFSHPLRKSGVQGVDVGQESESDGSSEDDSDASEQTFTSVKNRIVVVDPLGIKKDRENGRWRCPHCEVVCDEFVAYRRHVKIHRPLLPCSDCGKTFQDQSGLTRHFVMHSGIRAFTCHLCSKTFTQKNRLDYHMKVHFDERPYPCSSCERSFRERSQLNFHVRRVHLRLKPYSCTECDRTFSTPNGVSQHFVVHTGERPYECDDCGKSFTRPDKLKSHRLTHNKVKDFACGVCGKFFSRKDHRDTHRRRLHCRPMYECDECDMAFVFKKDLKAHVVCHLDEPVEVKPTFRCRKCQMMFRSVRLLHRHSATHRRKGRYVCHHCGKGVHMFSEFRRHVETHKRNPSPRKSKRREKYLVIELERFEASKVKTEPTTGHRNKVSNSK